MKKIISVFLVLAIVFTTFSFNIVAETLENAIEVKVYNPYRGNGGDLKTTVSSSDKKVGSKIYKASSSGAFCKNSAAVTSLSGDVLSTDLYNDYVVDWWCNIEISPTTDTFMIYLELPEFSADTFAVRLQHSRLWQNDIEFWINPQNAKYDYFDIYEGVWQSATMGTKGELNALGSDFKGYVRFDIKNFYNYATRPQGFDFDKTYKLDILQFGYNHIGGKNGDLIIGAYYSVLNDGDFEFIKNTATGEVLSLAAVSGDFDINGSLDSVDLSIAKQQILGTYSMNNAQKLRCKITENGINLNVRDLVRLKKSTLGINETRTITFKPSTCETDNLLSEQNPDRGFIFQFWAGLNNADDNKLLGNMWTYYPKFKTAAEKVKQGIWVDPNICAVAFYLKDYKDSETLPELYFKNMQTVIDAAASSGKKIKINFVYQEQMGTDPETDTPYYEQQASQEIILAHMKQLAPFLEKNKEKIAMIGGGFLGAFGEWHSYYADFYGEQNRTDGVFDAKKAWDNSTEFDEVEIIKGLLDMVPDEIYVPLRCPEYIEMFLDKYPNEKYARRLCIYNAAFFGYKSEEVAWPYHSMTNKASLYTARQSRIAPMSGEFFWGCQWYYPRVTGEQGILGFKYFHQNTFNVYHNSFEGTTDVAGTPPHTLWFYTEREGDMSIWARTEMDAKWLESNNVFYSPAWFCDKNGNPVSRSQYEFVRDHLGYRLALKQLKMNGKEALGNTLDISLDLVNYGFSAAFNLKSELVILDENNKIVSRVEAGNPCEWQNTCALETHNIKVKLKLPEQSGNYKLALYVHNTAGTGAYFANEIEHSNGFNILYNFSI